MQDNPYSAMLHVIRRDTAEHAVAPWRLGRVGSVSPLMVEMAGLQLAGGDLLVNPLLLPHTRSAQLSDVTGELSATCDDPDCAMSSLHVGGGGLSAMALLGGVLEVGDQVVLLASEDQQQYVVLCKVVSG